MQHELALEKLTEAREVVDDDVGEFIDAVAHAIVMHQGIRSPMLGAKVTLLLDDGPDDEIREHKAIVIEGDVAGDAPDGQLWDPNTEEYRTADDYPLGTVNCVAAQDYHSDELIDFEDGYATDVKVFTSITPANEREETMPHTYTPGWE